MGVELTGKVAVVTGGASGIGRATALAMSTAGARVAIADLSEAAGTALVGEIEARGGEALFVATDVARAAAVDALFDAVKARWGRLDCAFNNAGVADSSTNLADTSEDEWDRVNAINLKGVWLCLRREIRDMLAQGTGGAIVNTASVAGLVGWKSSSIYTATKHGVVGLTRGAALDYARQGIRVNAVCPGVIDTPMGAPATQSEGRVHDILLARHPAGRFGVAEEVARAVVWLCSDEASFTTGHALTVDGGYVVP
ncbi:MAG: SDR family oxidoreductase [Gammaproteobacteria bacterium]|nr:SDR family oxidoreductase [Gammaproteobacteria bacterium]